MLKPDFVRLWEEHTAHEFSTRDAEATLATMVDDAHVNHVPVMTGGCGKDQLRAFYSRDFIPSMPPDTKLTPVSRTVGEDQLVDEMIFSFTHTQEMPWMLPGIPPTHRRVEVPAGTFAHRALCILHPAGKSFRRFQHQALSAASLFQPRYAP